MSNNANEQVLMNIAIDSAHLLVRSEGNVRYGTVDFDAWVDQILEKISFSRVLDVCCGTGNQLVKYASRQGVEYIVGVDIAQESLAKAKERLISRAGVPLFSLACVKMEDMFNDHVVQKKSYDLISCFYGLYYAQNLERVVNTMIKHLDHEGSMIIVGPYGDNNVHLFKLLQRYFTLPELVSRSSTTFMEAELFPLLAKNMQVKREAFVNYIHYPSAQSLLNYWRSTTFYSQEHDAQVAAEIYQYFEQNDAFIVEKHVMAYIAKKVA